MPQTLRYVESDPSARASYLRFLSDDEAPFERTDSFGTGEVAVDLAKDGRVIGIEMLGTGPEELILLAQVARSHGRTISTSARSSEFAYRTGSASATCSVRVARSPRSPTASRLATVMGYYAG